MTDIFFKGDILISESGDKYVVDRIAGFSHGSEYYLVRQDDKFFGMRAYSFMPTGQFYYVKKKLYRTDIPENVNWPIEYVKNDKGFGIIDKIVDVRFKSCWDLAKNRISPSFEALINSCINLASVYKNLHEKDLIFNGEQKLFLDPINGDIFIENYDCIYSKSDNISYYGSYRFEAPELFNEGNKPNEKTDLHMLALYIFYLLMVSFPYEGKKEYEKKVLDFNAVRDIYGSPIYIFDPNNESNRPVKEYHSNAIIFHEIYPEYINTMFEKAFIDGAYNPEKRISEDEWINCLKRLKSDIIKCECGASNFKNANLICWNCRKRIIYSGETNNVIIKIYKMCPSIVNDRKKLKAYLMDYIPEDKKLQNVICLSFDEGIPQELEKSRNIDNIIIHRLKKKLIYSYDVSEVIADKVVRMWADIFDS